MKLSIVALGHRMPTWVAAGYADRVVFLSDGRVGGAMEAPTAQRVLDRMKSLGE